MPTKEELGISKPRRGKCENCPSSHGIRRRMGSGKYILCAECARSMNIEPSLARPKNHHSGGGSGRVRG